MTTSVLTSPPHRHLALVQPQTGREAGRQGGREEGGRRLQYKTKQTAVFPRSGQEAAKTREGERVGWLGWPARAVVWRGGSVQPLDLRWPSMAGVREVERGQGPRLQGLQVQPGS